MSTELPCTFGTIVVRDCWQWYHLDVPLLTKEEQERLENIPEETTHPFGTQWVNYAQQRAEELERAQCWLEAQAYWLAAAQILAQDNQQMSEAFTEVLAGIIRTSGCSAGMPATQQELEDLADEGLRNLSIPIQNAVVCSLLLIGTLQESIYDDLHLSNQARINLLKLLSPLQEQQKIKGSHVAFMESVKVYSQLVSQLSESVDAVAVNSTLENVKNERSRLLERLTRFNDFALSPDKATINRVRTLLSQELTAYMKASEDDLLDAYQVLKRNIRSITEECHSVGSYLGSCILLPLVLSIDRALSNHFTAAVHSRLPELKLQLLKPQVRRQGDAFIVEVKLANEGADGANDCILQVHKQPDISFKDEIISFGRVEVGRSIVRAIHLACPPDTSVLTLEYTLKWKDRSGSQQRAALLKVERQREIQWEQFENLAPYTIQSITESQKLKGRSNQLSELRRGFASKSSFMITGQKRVGKTSLVKVFLSELRERENVLPLYIPIGELSVASGDDLGRLGLELIMRVFEEYSDLFLTQIDLPIPTLEELRDNFGLFVTRIRQIASRYSLRIIFALDDFDELPTHLFTASLGKSLFLALRALIDYGVSFFFIGSERLPTIMNEQSERLNQVKPLKVGYLDRDALKALIEEPAEGYLEYTDSAISEIEVWSARNPYFATLICSAIWERALERRDCWVTEYDVSEAIQAWVRKSDRNSYKHFWSDSPLPEYEARKDYETKSSYLLLALSRLQPDPLTYANRSDVLAQCKVFGREEAKLHFEEMINYNVLEIDPVHTELVRIRVPLFASWLQHGGATELERDEMDKKRRRAGITQRQELPSSEVIVFKDKIFYRAESISPDEVRNWAAQFGSIDDQRLMLKLLHKLCEQGLYTEARWRHALTQMHAMVRQNAIEHGFNIYLGPRRQPQNIYLTHADSVGESGSALVTLYRYQNNIPERLCGGPDKIFTAVGKNASTKAIVICVDDFIGSGQSATEQLAKLTSRLHQIPRWGDRVLFIYATVVGFEKGMKLIDEHTGQEIIVLSFKVLTEADRAFSPENSIFDTAEERNRAREIAHRIGSVLEKDNPLGWENSQSLVVFPDNVPNNTLPIFYKQGVEYNGQLWRPLFPRA